MSITRNKQYTPSPKTERGKSYHLGGDPKEGRRIVYTAGQLVILKSLENPLDVFVYTGHKFPTTCARLTPSGFYVASADQGNNIIVWDTVGEDHVVKLEKQTFGKIFDMTISPDSKRVIAVGQGGSTVHGDCFFIDGGASCGSISNHSKPVLSVDHRSDRPFRLVSASEDSCVNFYEGPPFKYKASLQKHTRFVTCTRFSPNGAYAVSVGTDKKIVIYDGKTFDLLRELDNAHGGGIYAVSWSADSTRFLTASADKTCKIWDAESLTSLTTFQFGGDLNDQQLGCLWQGETLLSLNLAGDISILDPVNPAIPREVISGHSVAIEALAYFPDDDVFFSSDRDGKIVGWNRNSGRNIIFSGAPHKTRVLGLAVSQGNLLSVSLDDTVKISSIAARAYHEGIKLPAQPTGVGAASRSAWFAVSTREGVALFQGSSLVKNNAFSYGPTAVALSADGSVVAVGGGDRKIHVYNNNNGVLTEVHTVDHGGALCCVDVSEDGSLVAGGDSDREIAVWEGTTKISKNFGHGARVDKVRFSPGSNFLLSASLDSSVIVWDIRGASRVAEARNAHNGGVKDIFWVDQANFVSTGQDVLTTSWVLNP